MVKKKKAQGKVRRVVTIIKAKGQPDEVQVKRIPEAPQEPQPAPEAMRPRQVKLPRQSIRITPKTPRLQR